MPVDLTDQHDQNPRVEMARSDVLTRAEEHVTVGVRQVDRGGVRIETRTNVVDEVIPVDLASETVEVRRVPVDRVVDRVPGVREEDGVTIIPVLIERPVVTTELVLVEEIHVIRTRAHERAEVPVTLRRQEFIQTAINPNQTSDRALSGINKGEESDGL